MAALKAGGVGGASHAEFAIIRTGLSKSWEDAQRMYLADAGQAWLGARPRLDAVPATARRSAARRPAAPASTPTSRASASRLGAEKSNEREMTVTKDKDGSASYDTKQGQGDKRTAGANVSVGVVEGGASIGKTVTTSTGYKFLVKPGMKNARELQDQIARLANASQAEVDAFAKAHPETVVERSDVRDDERSRPRSPRASARREGNVHGRCRRRRHGDARRRRQDHRHQERGHNEGGLSVSAGGKHDRQRDQRGGRLPRVGADGERVVDVTRKDSETDTAKFLDSLPVVGTKKKKDKGALATATGAEEEDTRRATSRASPSTTPTSRRSRRRRRTRTTG